MPSNVFVRSDDAVTVIEMRRPETRNALTREMVRQITSAFRDAEGDQYTRAIVLAGSGGCFCSGADLRSGLLDDPNAASHIDEHLEVFQELIRTIVSTTKPVLAAVDGAAVGFGCDLALACDIRLVSSRSFFQERWVKLGLMPDGGGTYLLPRLVGVGRALEMMLFGSSIHGQEAVRIGLASRLVADDLVMTETVQVAAMLAAGPPLAIARIKRAVRESFDGTFEDALAREKVGQRECLRSQDCVEGVTAWSERREPFFKGR